MHHPNLTVVNHPLAHHKLTRMRDANCRTGEFRRLMREMGLMLAIEATRDLKGEPSSVVTKVEDEEGDYARYDGWKLAQEQLIAIPILRAGLPFAEAFLDLFPEARSGHFGLYHPYRRNIDTQPEPPRVYLKAIPRAEGAMYFVLDPMIATSATITTAIDILMDEAKISPDQIRVISLVAAREGLARFYGDAKRGHIKVFTAAVDPALNRLGMIVPGLGDAGDRLFGTEKAREG